MMVMMTVMMTIMMAVVMVVMLLLMSEMVMMMMMKMMMMTVYSSLVYLSTSILTHHEMSSTNMQTVPDGSFHFLQSKIFEFPKMQTDVLNFTKERIIIGLWTIFKLEGKINKFKLIIINNL